MKNEDIPRHSLTFHLGTNREVTVSGDGRQETRIVSYDRDDLKVTGKHLDFLKDPRFQRAYAKGAASDHKLGAARGEDSDIHIEYRVYMLLWAAEHALKLPGDFVESRLAAVVIQLFESIEAVSRVNEHFAGFAACSDQAQPHR